MFYSSADFISWQLSPNLEYGAIHRLIRKTTSFMFGLRMLQTLVTHDVSELGLGNVSETAQMRVVLLCFELQSFENKFH